MMASVQQNPAVQAERRPSTGAPVPFKSNNPFRRTESPASPPPPKSPLGSLAIPTDDLVARRISTNPFLDDYKTDNTTQPSPRLPSPVNGPSSLSPQRRTAAPGVDLFSDPPKLRERPSMMNAANGGSRPMPPRTGHLPVRSHRPTNSDDDRRVPPAVNDLSLPKAEASELVDKKENRRPRPRRNSESSVLDVKDDEARRHERRPPRDPRDGQDRTKDGRPREGRSSGRSRRPNVKIDLIDKLDLTGIYGGATFHHDGPFDACNPHRNRKGSRRAPMQAFPAGSQNNAMGGSGPVSTAMDYDRFHGRTVEGFTDFNATMRVRQRPAPERSPARPPRQSSKDISAWDSKNKIELVHGDETAGLGTSTFLEGAPVSRAALQRHESENETLTLQAMGGGSGGMNGGLQRKKSLAQKLRGMSRGRQGEAERRTSPEGFEFSPTSPEYVGVQSAGGRGKILVEKNPFFEHIAEDKSGDSTVIKNLPLDLSTGRQRAGSSSHAIGRARTASSPHRGLTRSVTNDGGSPGSDSKGGNVGGGLLSRVKSLKGKKRPEAKIGVAS